MSQSRLRRRGYCPHLHRATPCAAAARPALDVDARAARCSLSPSSSCAIRRTGIRRRGRTPNVRALAGCCVSRGTGISCRWWRPRNAWARRSPSPRGGGRCDDLVETADAFLALDDDGVRLERGRREDDDDDDASSATLDRVAVAAPRAGAAVDRWFAFWRGGADAARSRRRAVARSPSRRCWRGSTRRRRTTVETTSSRGPSRSRPDSTLPSRSASLYLEAPELESSDDEHVPRKLENIRELGSPGEASLRHPELEEPPLERTPRSWEDRGRVRGTRTLRFRQRGRPRHPPGPGIVNQSARRRWHGETGKAPFSGVVARAASPRGAPALCSSAATARS